METYGYALIYSITGYLGIQVVLTLVRTCGALAAATVTTARKAITIALSFLAFTKPFTVQCVIFLALNIYIMLLPIFRYFWSGAIVVLGIYLNVYSKKHKDFGMKEVRRIYYSAKSVLVKPRRKLISSV